MNRKLQDSIATWLTEEDLGRDELAESALRQVFAEMPLVDPPAGFADRVMLAIAPLTVAETAPVPLLARLFKVAAVLCLLLGGVAAAILPSILLILGQVVSPGRLVEAGAALLLGACNRLVAALSFWNGLADTGQLVSNLVARPGILATLAVALMVSLAASRLLYGLMTYERSASHVRDRA